MSYTIRRHYMCARNDTPAAISVTCNCGATFEAANTTFAEARVTAWLSAHDDPALTANPRRTA